MIGSLVAYLKRGLQVKEVDRGFFLTLTLLAVVPFAFLYTGQQFLNAGKDTQERAERARIGTLHDVFVASLLTRADAEATRWMMQDIVAQNPDIARFALVEYADGRPKVRIELGAGESLELYDELFKAAGLRSDESLLFETTQGGVRHWIGVRAVPADPLPTRYIFTDITMGSIDALYQRAVMGAYGILALVILVLSILIIRHARIINYAALYAELHEALKAKTQFITMTAHELRAPATAMRGYASMISERTAQDPDVLAYAKRIEDASAYMVSLVSDLLDVAKLDSGSVALAKERVDVGHVVAEAVETLAPVARERKIGLTSRETGHGHAIMADQKRLTQVLINIVGNALKYTKQGSVTVVLREEKGKIEVRVEDTGMGMTAQDREKLFSPYFRTEEGAASGATGTGLGLWITKQFIERMGGAVSVESIHGVGTHVVLSFPKAG